MNRSGVSVVSRAGASPLQSDGIVLRRISGSGGHRLTVHNRWTYDAKMEVPEERVARFGRDQDASFRRRFPRIGEVKMAYRWAGRLCLSKNSVPAFGEVEDGIYSGLPERARDSERLPGLVPSIWRPAPILKLLMICLVMMHRRNCRLNRLLPSVLISFCAGGSSGGKNFGAVHPSVAGPG